MSKKVLKWIIGIIIILILILIMTLFYIKNNVIYFDENSKWVDTSINNDGEYDEAEDLEYNQIKKVTDKDDFATVYKYIEKYIDYCKSADETRINNIVDLQYKEKNSINMNEYSNTEKFIVDSAYYENEKLTITRYYIFGQKEYYLNDEYVYKDVSFIVRCDYDNMTISIVPIENLNEKDIDKIQQDYKYIDKDIYTNEDNMLEFSKLEEKSLINIYMNKYILYCLNKTDEAYNNLLNEEYRNKRFLDIAQYEEYTQLKENELRDFLNIEYKKQNDNVYKIKDNYNNYYTIIEKAFMDFTIKLDDYTIIDEDETQLYKDLKKEDKVKYDINIFLKMINNYDYDHAYEKLDETFKNNNFKTREEFIKYIKEEFFEKNYLSDTNCMENHSGIYVVQTKIKSDISKAADIMDKSFIIKIGDNTDYKISFNIN